MPNLVQQVSAIVQDMGHQPEPELVRNVYESLAHDHLDRLCDEQPKEPRHGYDGRNN